MKKELLIAGLIFALFCAALARLDRLFFKRNHGFCAQMILSTLQPRLEWQTAELRKDERAALQEILKQKFFYLSRGGQSAAFLSEDGKTVIKFYRFPSHLRPLGFLKHPFAYQWSAKRSKIKAHNFEKLETTFGSFLLAYQELKEESGLLYLHLNPTTDLKQNITLVDRLKNHYQVSLDHVAFIVQRRAYPIYETLQKQLAARELDCAKQALSSLLDLIAALCAKGIIDHDAILSQNYGFYNQGAMLVDIGRLAHNSAIQREGAKGEHIRKMTAPLQSWLQERSPELAAYFEDKIAAVLPSRS